MSPDLKDLFYDAGGTPPRPPGWDADDVVRRGARIRTRRRVLAGAATLGVAAVVVGGSIALSARPGTRARRSHPATARPPARRRSRPALPASRPRTRRPPPTPTPSPTWTWCRADDVTLTLSHGGAAAGTAYSVIMIKARPGITCNVEGFPSLRHACARASSSVRRAIG